MKDFHITKKGKLIKKENTVYFVSLENEKIPLPVDQIEELFLHDMVTVSSQVIHFFAQKGIVIHFFNHYGFYDGSFFPKANIISGEVLVRQAEHYLNNEKRLELARKFVEGAIKNALVNLRVYKIEKTELMENLEKVNDITSIPELMAIEGNSKRIYYRAWNNIILNPYFQFEKRERQPPSNMLNALISFVNSLVYAYVAGEIYNTHLSPFIGFLHEPFERRFSLALDIAEIFKPLFGDRLIFYLINKRVVSEEDFVKEMGGVFLTERGRKKIVKIFTERINNTVKHKTLKRNVSYRRLIRLECYKIERHILGVEKYKPLVAWW